MRARERARGDSVAFLSKRDKTTRVCVTPLRVLSGNRIVLVGTSHPTGLPINFAKS